jgi:hypothetical protein
MLEAAVFRIIIWILALISCALTLFIAIQDAYGFEAQLPLGFSQHFDFPTVPFAPVTFDVPNPGAGHTLTDEEYRFFTQMREAGSAAPLQVGLMKAAVVGVALLLASVFWMAFLWFLRRQWNFWFDKDLWDNIYASTVVVCVLLYCTKEVLVAAIKGVG